MTKSKRILSVVLITGFIIISSCATSMFHGESGILTPHNPRTDSVFVNITSHDLSEDMSKILSTKNDELLVLIYEYQDSTILEAPLFQEAFTVNATEKTHAFYFDKAQTSIGSNLLFLLVEQDFGRPIEQIDPVIRVQYQSLLQAFRARDYQQIKRLLGSEDLLGYHIINAYQPKEIIRFKIEGVHKLDFYDYTIEVKRK